MSLASVGPNVLERVCALRFEKQAPRQPAGLENQDCVIPSSIDPGSRRMKLVRNSNVSKTLSTGTNVEKTLKEASRPVRKKEEERTSSTVDRYGKEQTVCEGSYDVSRSFAGTVGASMLLYLYVPDDGSSFDNSVNGVAASEDL